MDCIYTLTINGQEQSFDYKGLVEFMANHMNTFTKGNLSDIVFSQNTNQEDTISLLKDIKQDVEWSFVGANELTGEPIYVGKGTDISVSQIIEEALDTQGNPIVTPMSVEDYKKNQSGILINRGMNPDEALQTVNDELSRWKVIGDNSARLHDIVRNFFNGESDENIIKIYKDKLPESALTKFMEDLKAIKRQLEVSHGLNARFAGGYMITAPLKGENRRVLGNIDLVVVDERGQAHIYLFKGSSRDYSERQNVKEKKYDYQLAFYRQMLASNGINVKNMTLNIVPMRMYGKDGELESVSLERTHNRVNENNRLLWENGEYYRNVNNLIPVKVANRVESTDLFSTVQENMRKAFPSQNLDLKRRVLDSDTFIFGDRELKIAPRVQDSADQSKGAYQFWDKVNRRTIYIKDKSPKASNLEIKERVTEYLANEADFVNKQSQTFMHNIQRVLDGELQLDEIYPDYPELSNFITLKFKKYQNGEWEVVDNARLASLNIFLLHNKTYNTLDVVSFSTHNLNSQLKLDFGKSLLGCFERDEHIIPKHNLLLMATNGNIDLMKVMFAINESPEIFANNTKLGDIMVLNNNRQESTQSVSRKAVRASFNILSGKIGVNNKLSDSDFIDELTLFKSTVEPLLTSGGYGNQKYSIIHNNIWSLEPTTSYELKKSLENIGKQLVDTFPELKNNSEWIANNSDRESVQIYLAIYRTISSLESDVDQIVEPTNIERLGTSWRNQTLLNGSQWSNPQFIGEKTLKVIVSKAMSQMSDIRGDIANWASKFQEKYVKPLEEEKGYGKSRKTLIGDQFVIYSNLFVKDSSGNISNSMMFKNPYSSNSQLSKTESDFLKYILYEINRYRFGLEGNNDPRAELFRNDPKWYQVPLIKAIKPLPNKVKENVHEASKGIGKWIVNKFTSQNPEMDENTRNEVKGFYEMTSHFDRSDREGYRDEMLASTTSSDWETNIETLMLNYMFNRMMVDGMNKILPWISGVKAVMQVYSRENNVDITNTLQFIDDFVGKAVKNETLLDEEAQRAQKHITAMKYFASAFCLGFAPIAGVRQMMEGVWKGLSMSFSKYYGKDQFSIEDITKAWGLMVGEGISMSETMKTVEAINNRWGIVNRDFNILAERLNSTKSGIYTPMSKYLFWFTMAPDYFHRMSLIIAQMMHDGTWESCKFENGELKYNWKKDKRFSLLANSSSDKNSAEYKKQLMEWKWLRDMLDQEKGTTTEDFGELSSPYERAKVESLKTFSDLTYGFYDHETRMMFESTVMGSFIMQFRTYLTGAKNKYLLTPGAYGKQRTQLVDERIGQPVFQKEEVDEKGNSKWSPTLEDTGVPMWDYSGNWMEGIVWSLVDAWKDFKKDGYNIMNVGKHLTATEARKRSMRELSKDLLMLFMLGVIGKLLAEMLLQNTQQELKGHKPTLAETVGYGTQKLFTKAYLGSYGDFGILAGLYDFGNNVEPASIGIIGNFFGSTGQLVTGNKSFDSWANTNFGLYRSFKGFTEAATESIQAVQ